MSSDNLKSDDRLKKVLTRRELTYLSLGGIIGSGWLFAPLAAAAYAGYYSIFSWIIGGIMMILIALSYAEVSSMLPKSGGIIRYPHYTHGRIVGFFMFWTYLISAISTVSIEAVATTTYLSHFFPSLYSSGNLTMEGILVTYILLVLFFFANYFGVKGLGRISHGIGWWKLIIPSLTALILFAFFNYTNFSLPVSNAINGTLYAIPASGIVFSYLGFRQAIEYGGEGKNPQKDIPFAIISSLVISMIIFTVLEIGFIGALNWSAIGIQPGNWNSLITSSISNSPILSIFKIHSSSLLLALDIWISILVFDSIISPAGTGIIYTGTSVRTLFGSSNNGYLPKIFSEVNKRGIPFISLIISVIGAAIFLLPIPSWYSIVNISSSATVLTYIMGGIGLHSFRKNYPNLKRVYSLSNWKIISPLSTIMAGLLVYWSGFSTLFYIIVIGFIGLSIYLVFYSKYPIMNVISMFAILISSILFYNATSSLSIGNNLAFLLFILLFTGFAILELLFLKIDKNEIRATYWLVPFLSSMLLLSYLGPFGLNDLIPFPYDIPIVSVVILVFHYLAVKNSIPNLIEEKLEAE
ncbi:APC family permease [Acidianus manzaensis]|uniref:Amino acid permease n=1 Tax=Acidianus manzaensis TaxID=282676 RepID=A0A1W6JYA1_9CREN|nr:APC family permease [Acidianus manzaensis]ARM75227.1 hypothetical protein B6F84_03730 [Acidianus manzaensis]